MNEDFINGWGIAVALTFGGLFAIIYIKNWLNDRQQTNHSARRLK
jgi:hypothetical protein